MAYADLYIIYARRLGPLPTITITIDVPEGAAVDVGGLPAEELSPEAGTVQTKMVPGGVERYWRGYLSDNGRELYGAAAAIEREIGIGYTLADIAERMGRKYASAQSIHRTTGRSARKWKDDTGTEAPIRLEWIEYEWDESEGGMRTQYRLPEGVADEIGEL
ncbi:MAG TPA: hypothetical protein VGW75_04535 [Solirubrobacteraceae bacterium]|nr:hypothetical protein [Solirubrobacteraceae bacterium]